MNLVEYDFDCSICKQSKKTLVSREKSIELANRSMTIQSILKPSIYNASYREIFVSNMCCTCQKDVFGETDDIMYDINKNDNIDSIKPQIEKMYRLESGN